MKNSNINSTVTQANSDNDEMIENYFDTYFSIKDIINPTDIKNPIRYINNKNIFSDAKNHAIALLKSTPGIKNILTEHFENAVKTHQNDQVLTIYDLAGSILDNPQEVLLMSFRYELNQIARELIMLENNKLAKKFIDILIPHTDKLALERKIHFAIDHSNIECAKYIFDKLDNPTDVSGEPTILQIAKDLLIHPFNSDVRIEFIKYVLNSGKVDIHAEHDGYNLYSYVYNIPELYQLFGEKGGVLNPSKKYSIKSKESEKK